MSGKSDGADDAAVLVSRKYLEELVRNAEAGRIFHECGEALAKVDEAYLDKNPRTANDVRQTVLNSLMIIGDRFRGAGMFKANVGALPWPLFLFMMELFDVSEGYFSPLLTPGTASKKANARPKGTPATNTACAKCRAAAIVTYERLAKCEAWADGKAASAIAEVFRERGVKVRTPKSLARQNKSDETVTPATVKEWVWKSRGSVSTRLAREIDRFRKLTDELYQESLSRKHDNPENNESCEVLLLDFLRRYIAGTAYET